MINYQFYKLFNPELKNLNNTQLLFHWKNIGIKEQKINSIDSFFNIYPYYDHDSYKKYNPELNINDKIELMRHWHNIGYNENKICSDKHFNILYPNIDIDTLNENKIDDIEFKKNYHKSNIVNKLINNNIFITDTKINTESNKNINKEIYNNIINDELYLIKNKYNIILFSNLISLSFKFFITEGIGAIGKTFFSLFHNGISCLKIKSKLYL
jgi:hypothetical protein